jgi:hypothetical protein
MLVSDGTCSLLPQYSKMFLKCQVLELFCNLKYSQKITEVTHTQITVLCLDAMNIRSVTKA